MLNKIYEYIKKYIKENYKFLLTIVFILFFFLYELPFVVYKPGGLINLSERIEVEDATNSSGSYNMTYVSMLKGNIPFVLLSFIMPNWDLVSTSEVTVDNESVDDTIKRDKIYLEQGIDNAIISAYNLAGKSINITNISHIVTYIDSNANTNLELGDIVLSIDNNEFSSLDNLKSYINTLNEGDKVSIKVKRSDNEIDCYAYIYKIEDTLKIGISILDEYDLETDPKVEVTTKDSETGSSGGLMTALAIYDALVDIDLTKGLTIAGTGTIDSEGNVGEISGVKYKLLGAKKSKADIFLCPEENYEEALKIKEENGIDIEIVSVKTLNDAIDYLKCLQK